MALLEEMKPYEFTQADLDMVKKYLDRWKTSKRDERSRIAHKVYKRIQDLDKTVTKAILKKKKQGIYYFFHKYGRTRKAQERFHYIKRWTHRMVLAETYRDRVHKQAQELAGNAPPGSQAFLSNYQIALSKVLESVEDEEIEEAKDTAKDWNSRGPPTDIQKKMARTHSTRTVQQFCKQMKKGYGADSLVLYFYEDQDDNIVVKFHECMEELGGKSFIKSNPGWENLPILELLAQHAEAMYPNHSGTQTDTALRTKQKPLVQLEVDDEGYPELPEEWESLKLMDKKELVRSMVTVSYRTATGRQKSSVPWKDMGDDLRDFVTEEHWPTGCRISDPSHLQKVDVDRLLNLWHDRQTARQPAFRFHRVKDLEGNFMPPVEQRKVPHNGQKRKAAPSDQDLDEEEPQPKRQSKSTNGKRRKVPAKRRSFDRDSFANFQSSDESGNETTVDRERPAKKAKVGSSSKAPQSVVKANSNSNKKGPPAKKSNQAENKKGESSRKVILTEEEEEGDNVSNDAGEAVELTMTKDEPPVLASGAETNSSLPAVKKTPGKSRAFVEIVTSRKPQPAGTQLNTAKRESIRDRNRGLGMSKGQDSKKSKISKAK